MSDRRGLLLLVEDDDAVAAVYRIGLEKDGFQVLLAPDGEKGVDLARASSPDLVLLDIGLPKLDGFGVLEALRASPQTAALPVAVLSNSMLVDDARVDRAYELGILEWLVKSRVPPADLSRLVAGWLAPPA